MINFDNLEVVKEEETKAKQSQIERYVISCDPWQSKPDLNCILIWDKVNNKEAIKITTKLPFDTFVERFLAKEVDKKMYKVSKNLVNANGYAKSVDQLREERVRAEGGTTNR